jgi:hypothetical protein
MPQPVQVYKVEGCQKLSAEWAVVLYRGHGVDGIDVSERYSTRQQAMDVRNAKRDSLSEENIRAGWHYGVPCRSFAGDVLSCLANHPFYACSLKG